MCKFSHSLNPTSRYLCCKWNLLIFWRIGLRLVNTRNFSTVFTAKMLGDNNGYCKCEIKYISHVQLQRLPNLPCLKRLWFTCFPSSETKCLCAKIRIGLFLVRIWHFTSKTFKKKLKLTTVCSCFFCNDPQKMFPSFFNELRGKMKLHII